MPNGLWLMWGWLNPKERSAPRLVVKRQGTYSETNYNLLLEPDSEREFRPRDFELGQLLGALGGPLPHESGRLLEAGRLSPLWGRGRRRSPMGCARWRRGSLAGASSWRSSPV